MAPRRHSHSHAAMWLCSALLVVARPSAGFQLPRPSLTGLRNAASRVARGITPFSTVSTPATAGAAAAAVATSAPVRTPQPATAYPPMQYSGGDGQVRFVCVRV